MKYSRNVHTFIGCDNSYEDSRIVLFGAPFDGTASYRPGARFASAAVRNESYSIETYSPYLDKDLSDIQVFDGGDLDLPFGSPQRALEMIESHTAHLLQEDRFPFMIGGEHLVTLGAVRAAVRRYPDLYVIHFDAHTDLRDEYQGEHLSHATVMRRCWELTGDGRIFQFGVRSGDREEFIFAREHILISPFNFEGLEAVASNLIDVPVYLTIDLDVLDPSAFPGTGTPEAGGVSFTELLNAVRLLSGLKIVGLDLTELNPAYDSSGISTALTCKLIRELLLQIRPPKGLVLDNLDDDDDELEQIQFQ